MFYRIHASIIKMLKYKESLDYDLMEQHLDDLTKQPIYSEIVDVDSACVKGRQFS